MAFLPLTILHLYESYVHYKLCSVSVQLVGGPFDLKENLLIREPTVLLLLVELLPRVSEEIQVSSKVITTAIFIVYTLKKWSHTNDSVVIFVYNYTCWNYEYMMVIIVVILVTFTFKNSVPNGDVPN